MEGKRRELFFDGTEEEEGLRSRAFVVSGDGPPSDGSFLFSFLLFFFFFFLFSFFFFFFFCYLSLFSPHPSFPTEPPLDGEDYLRRVRWEAKKCADIVIADDSL